MQIPTVKAEPRSASGSKLVRKLRAEGKVPCVLYGKGKENENLQLASSDIEKLIHDTAHVVQLDIAGKKTHALLRAMQRDRVEDELQHLDLLRIELSDQVRVRIPLLFVGTSKGAAHGGVQEVLRGDVDLHCPAQVVPKQIVVDVSALDIGDAVRLRDLKLPEGATLVDKPDRISVHVTHPRKAEETAAATPEAAAAGAAPAAGAAAGAAAPAAAAGKGAAPAAAPAKGAAPAAAAKAPAAKK